MRGKTISYPSEVLRSLTPIVLRRPGLLLDMLSSRSRADFEMHQVKLPRGWKIDNDEKLYGHVNGWATHVLVATGKTDVRQFLERFSVFDTFI